MAIELTPATQAEIAEFKQAAAARFAERGIPPKQAAVIFDAYMRKLAAQLGVSTGPSPVARKLAEAMKAAACKAKAKGKKPAVKKAGITSGVSRVVNVLRAMVPGAVPRAQRAVQQAGAATISGGPAINLQRAQVRLFDIQQAAQGLAKMKASKVPFAAGTLAGAGAGAGIAAGAGNK